MKLLAYLQCGFWRQLSESTSLEGIRTMLELSDALIGSEVITDLSEEMIMHDKFLMVFLKKGKYKRCNENYISKQIEALATTNNVENLCATYLLENNTIDWKMIEGQYGVIVLNALNIAERRYIFKGDGFSFEKKKRYETRYSCFRSKLFHPNNSLLIIDPYLLKKRSTDKESGKVYYPGLQNNLESLLDALLPQKLAVDYHLTIITSLEKDKENGIKNVYVKSVYEKVRKCLRKIRKQLYVKLCVVYTDHGFSHQIESFHSRHILSNTFAIDSEDGFDLFNEKGYLTKNNPSITIVFPRMFGDSRQDVTKYFNWISSVKNYINEAPETYVYGDNGNRLFDLIQP